jgi:peptidoglycan/xylan/chitin deacetylase (PgdA/CDA1 family)
MNRLRVLLLSNTRPSRSWRFALRIAREIPGGEICGIVQRPLCKLPPEQRVLAKGKGDVSADSSRLTSRIGHWVRSCFEGLIHTIVWCVHGFPRGLNIHPAFTVESLAEKCAEAGWPFFEAVNIDDSRVAHFMDCMNPDLVIALGETPALPTTNIAASRGWLRARSNDVVGREASGATGLHIRVEYLSKPSGPSQDLTSLNLPRQVHDTRIGFALKSDLVTDDLLAQSAAAIRVGCPGEAAKNVTAWAHEVLFPYLSQVGPSRPAAPAGVRWYRSVWSLAIETIVLCSPVVVARNWFRHLRRRHPVLILVHHLVSDRAHRMSISTEAFWRQLLFLRRHYLVVPLSKAAELLDGGSVPIPTVSLTFDDGYADNFVSLRAVAEELNVPVSLFITTQPVDLRSEFHHDVIKGLHGAFPMNWAQIRYWKQRGAEIGSHTRTHIRCGVADRALLHEEIAGSKADFENHLGEAPRFFAFPFGTPEDISAEAINIAAHAYPHFLSACGGENFPERSGNNAHLFRKNAYPEPWELELELQSIFDLVQAAKRRFRISPRRAMESFARSPRTLELSTEPSLNFSQSHDDVADVPTQIAQPVIRNN